MKRMSTLIVAASAVLASCATASADSGTIRILHEEPYGAVVTKEAGVLVFRGLPPTRKVIVNPDGKTPLQLTQSDVTETNVVVVTDQESYLSALGPKIIRLK